MAPAFDVLRALPNGLTRSVLERLHQRADREAPRLVLRMLGELPRFVLRRPLRWKRLGGRFDDSFISLDRTQGIFCYLLARALRARRIVEFGTSFGISTIYLAQAVRDNGGGVVVGTERVPAKAERALAHLDEAGLADLVDLRVGDARETLRNLPDPVDFFLNDGFPPYALPVLRLVAPMMDPGAVVVTDNVGLFAADHSEYLEYVRDPDHGFVSAPFPLNDGVELSVRVARPPRPATVSASGNRDPGAPGQTRP